MALTTAIFDLVNSSSNVTLIAEKLTESNGDDYIDSEEFDGDDGSSGSNGGNKLALVVIFTGVALALFFTCFLLICCKFFAKVSRV